MDWLFLMSQIKRRSFVVDDIGNTSFHVETTDGMKYAFKDEDQMIRRLAYKYNLIDKPKINQMPYFGGIREQEH